MPEGLSVAGWTWEESFKSSPLLMCAERPLREEEAITTYPKYSLQMH